MINGGTFNAYDENGENPAAHPVTGATIAGGNFNYSAGAADGFEAVDNGDGSFVILPELENGLSLSAVGANYPGLYTDGTDYYTYTAEGLISMRNLWQVNWGGNSMWGRTYHVMADINATGYTWNEVWVVVGNNDNAGFVFDGHGHTITGLTINGALFSGTPNGGNRPDAPGYMKNITFDGVTVVGDHTAAVLWSGLYNELVVENVTVKNSTITGNCNVAALIAATVTEGGEATVTFKNCTVENNVIKALGKDNQDPTGASAFVGRAFDRSFVKFEGANVAKDNTITNENGLVGGGIYGYTVWANGGFYGTDSCYTFTNYVPTLEYTVKGTTVMLTPYAYDSIVYHDRAGYTEKIKAMTVYTKGDLESYVALAAAGVIDNNGTNDIHAQLIFGANIDFGGADFTGLSFDAKNFDIYGNGYTLSNVNFVPRKDGKAGLIPYAGNNVIKSLTIKDATVTGAQAGIFAGNASNVKLEACALAGDVTVNWQANTAEPYNGVGAAFGVLASEVSRLDVNTANATIAINQDGITYAAGKTAETDTNLIGVVYGGSYVIADTSTVYINAAWAGSAKDAKVGDGLLFGVNAFASMLDFAVTDNTTAIVIYGGTYSNTPNSLANTLFVGNVKSVTAIEGTVVVDKGNLVFKTTTPGEYTISGSFRTTGIEGYDPWPTWAVSGITRFAGAEGVVFNLKDAHFVSSAAIQFIGGAAVIDEDSTVALDQTKWTQMAVYADVTCYGEITLVLDVHNGSLLNVGHDSYQSNKSVLTLSGAKAKLTTSMLDSTEAQPDVNVNDGATINVLNGASFAATGYVVVDNEAGVTGTVNVDNASSFTYPEGMLINK